MQNRASLLLEREVKYVPARGQAVMNAILIGHRGAGGEGESAHHWAVMT